MFQGNAFEFLAGTEFSCVDSTHVTVYMTHGNNIGDVGTEKGLISLYPCASSGRC